MSDAGFSVGAVVRRIAAPDQVGIVREAFASEYDGEWLYRVQFSQQKLTQPESALELLPDSNDPWRDLIDGRTSGPDAFHRLLAFERIRRPASRIAASFGTAKAKLLPFQFKPLLKFLESPSKRLLIADDVGLGKTVEAGYIFRELNAHQGIERCLVVVPARLRTKWKGELKSRFDETFEIVRVKEIRAALIEPLQANRDPDPFRWIASYETIRHPDVAAVLTEFQPGLDLVILDEAHRVRNVDTAQHRAVRELSRCADAMVMLSATPVQTSIENLFRLLSLLDPVTFAAFDTFQRQLRANQPVVQALASIRLGKEGLARAAAELQTLRLDPLTASLTTEGFFASILDRLSLVDPNDRPRLVELQRDIAELSLTGQFISRTRKADVIPNKPERVPQSVKITLTQRERAFYLAVADFFLDKALSSSWGVSMALLTALRQTASCMPAAARHFEAKGLTGEWSLELGRDSEEAEEAEEAEDTESDVDDSSASRTLGVDVWRNLAAAVDLRNLQQPASDSKFGEFKKALLGIWSADEESGNLRRKVIVFAFFRGTLNYLSDRFDSIGINHRLIHGAIPAEDRESRINEFVNDDRVHVLLSSEVGSEGVDLQVASVVVNYDLPWNPMVVEQRIGRVDRLGQKANVLTIVNLVLENTIEDRILMRLYERIDLFKNSIGEIDEILGQSVQSLVTAGLRRELTDAELSRRVDQQAFAFLNELKQAEQLQSDADRLLAGDQSFLDEVQGLIGFRKVPGPEELYRFLRVYLDSRYPGCRVPEEALTSTATAELQPSLGARLTNAFPGEPDVKRVAGVVQTGQMPMTFDSDAYLRVGRTEFISMHHPLIRLSVHEMEGELDSLHRAFRLQLAPGDGVDQGTYLLSVIELEVSGVRPRRELVPTAIALGATKPCSREMAQTLFVASLGAAGPVDWLSPGATALVEQAAEALQREAHAVRAELAKSESTLGAVRAARRRATQEGTLDRKVASARQRVAALRAKQAQEAVVRMEEGRLRKAEALLQAFLDETEPVAAAHVSVRDVAVALLRVESLR